MFIEAAVCITLVHYEHFVSVPTVNIIRQEHVYMVAVHTLCATNVAVGVLHFGLPFLAVSIYATTYRAFRLFNGYVECANLNVSFLVVACLFLCFGRVGVYLCLCCLYLLANGRCFLFSTTKSR